METEYELSGLAYQKEEEFDEVDSLQDLKKELWKLYENMRGDVMKFLPNDYQNIAGGTVEFNGEGEIKKLIVHFKTI